VVIGGSGTVDPQNGLWKLIYKDMKRIKKFKNFFIGEELVTKLKVTNTHNIFSSIFNSDHLKLKEFIQKSIGVENLKFIAGGAIGLAFDWKDKVIKFTTDLNEKRGVEKMMQLSSGDKKISGFAKYYWIKEVDLPGGNWKKNSPDTADQIDRLSKQRILSKSGTKSQLLTPDEIEVRKKTEVVKKAYIICLEKLQMLNKVESEMAHLVFLLIKHGYLDPKIDNSGRLSSLLEWINSDREEYNEPDYLKLGIDKVPIFSSFEAGITKRSIFSDDDATRKNYESMWRGVSKRDFLDFSNKMISLYREGDKLGIPTSDIHEGNIGWRGDELVAFDCM
jgi:hypothetical protein